jgi:peptidoglycan hydrolase-like protein with peptidoglycan-binding domain
MQAPRDLARRDQWAQSVARALTPPSLAPALAVERDLSDPGVWQDSIWRSQRRREAFERQLNFGPLTGKRVAVPLAMLAAGLMVRDAAVSGGEGLGAFMPSSADSGAPAKRVAHRVEQVKPATVAGRRATVSKAAHAPAVPAARHAAAKKEPTAASIAAARPKPPKNPMADGELTRGEHGAAVASMQQKLGVPADGIYGPSTLSAVETFQKGQGLVSDGRVGPATQAALAHPRPVAKPTQAKPHHRAATRSSTRAHAPAPAHVHGNGVKALQSALQIPADGVFGRGTAHAVRAFQRQHGLKADGVVGAATWSALGVRDPGKVLHQQRAHSRRGGAGRHASAQRSHRGGGAGASHHGTSVSDLQRLLGIPGDGVFGRQTARAVRDFQRHHGLRADGVVGPATWAALGVPNAHRVLHPRHSAPGPRHSSGGGGSSGASGVVARAIAAGDRIATLPYRYGGGHGSFNDSGYDCSGSVSYVLHGAGLLSSPLDSSALMSYGAPGPGRHITIYANSGHAFMTIDGRRFDTGYGGHGNRWASGSRPTGGYVVRHPPGL